MKEEDRMRSVGEGTLSTYEVYFQGDGTPMSRVMELKTLCGRRKCMGRPANILWILRWILIN